MPKDIFKEIRDLEKEFTPERVLHGGVSGSKVIKGMMGTNGSSRSAVIKLDKGIGPKESEGAQFISPYLLAPAILALGDNYVVFEHIEGETIDRQATTNPNNVGALSAFLSDHVSLWENTQTTTDQHPQGGYGSKTQGTKSMVYGQRLGSDGPIIGEFGNKRLVVNGVSMMSLDEIFQGIESVVLGQQIVTKTHGDEGLGNGIQRATDGQIISIDNCTAGFRSPYESIAKLELWLPATQLIGNNFIWNDTSTQMHLESDAKIPAELQKPIDTTRDKLAKYVADDESIKQLAAYMSMYLFRELQWLEKRGRSNMLPHIFIQALLYAGAMDGVVRHYPLPKSH